MFLSLEMKTDLYNCVTSRPDFARFEKIYSRTLGYLLVAGTPDQQATAFRVLSTCDSFEEAQRKALLTKEQAVTNDDGDFTAEDPRSFAGAKYTGSATAFGSSGPTH